MPYAFNPFTGKLDITNKDTDTLNTVTSRGSTTLNDIATGDITLQTTGTASASTTQYPSHDFILQSTAWNIGSTTELDYMEYASDAAARAVWASNGVDIDSYVKFLLHMDGANNSTTFTDEMSHTFTARGDAKIDAVTTDAFGGTSGVGAFDGTGDYADTPDTIDSTFGTGNWTVDFWVYFNVDPNGGYANVDLIGQGQGAVFGWTAALYSTGKLGFYGPANTPGIETTSQVFTEAATWYHVEINRYGTGANNMRMFVNGTSAALTWYAGMPENYDFTDVNSPFAVGGGVPNGFGANLNGKLDEIRISKGIARHTANFTPPTAPYANALQDYSEGTIKSQGSYSLKAVAAATTALNKTITRTGASINLTDKTSISYDVYSSRTGSNLSLAIHDSGGTTSTTTITVNTVNTWETKSWDISGIANAGKDNIDQIVITITNADAANTFYIDNVYASTTQSAETETLKIRNVATGNLSNPTYKLSILDKNGTEKTSVNYDGHITTVGDIETTDTTKGLVLVDADDVRWRVTVNTAGTLVVTSL